MQASVGAREIPRETIGIAYKREAFWHLYKWHFYPKQQSMPFSKSNTCGNLGFAPWIHFSAYGQSAPLRNVMQLHHSLRGVAAALLTIPAIHN